MPFDENPFSEISHLPKFHCNSDFEDIYSTKLLNATLNFSFGTGQQGKDWILKLFLVKKKL